MPKRRFTLVIVLAMLIAACGTPAADVTTTSNDAATTQAVEIPEATKLSYDLQSGTSHSYEVQIDQTIDMTATGDATAMGEEEVPGEMSIQIGGTSTFGYSVADGPTAGTYAVTITGDFTDLDVTGTVDGEPVTSQDIPDFAEIEPIETTLIVDEQGNIIPESDEELGEDMFGALGGLGSLGSMQQLGAGGFGQFVGPPLTTEEVTVGDTWSETVETPTLPGDAPITTVYASEVVDTDAIDGHDVFVIESTATTSPIEFDLAELLLGFMAGFTPEGTSEEDLAELDALTAELRFAFSVDETVADSTTWFDIEAGLARVAETSSTTHMVFDMNVPDETTGELVEFAMDMDMASAVTYRLVDSSST